jgi:hypothetical protein
MDQFAEVIENSIAQPDGDPGLARFQGYDRTTPTLAEIVFALRSPCFSYWARSHRIARRAEITLMRSPAWCKSQPTRGRGRPYRWWRNVLHPGPHRVTVPARTCSKTVAAPAKSTWRRRRFVRALRSSHSNSTAVTPYAQTYRTDVSQVHGAISNMVRFVRQKSSRYDQSSIR